MKYQAKYPSVTDLATRARKRVPGFAMDYLDGAIGDEMTLKRNRSDLERILLVPRYLVDMTEADTRCELFGHTYDLGIGVSPVGLGCMLWPEVESVLARAAQDANIPYVLSTMSTTPLETIPQIAPDVCWFQMYIPQDIDAMKDLLSRIKRSGYKVLVITVDIPVGAKRDRELKNGLVLPFKLSPKILWQSLFRPAWALQTIRHGIPDFINLRPYRKDGGMEHLSEFLTSFFMCGVTPERIKMIRDLWQGPLVIKGLQRCEDVENVISLGVDGVIISNHGGRQLDAAPSSIESLRALPAGLLNKTTVMMDGGIRTGLDVVRSRVLGAQCCFSGRSFIYGICGAGEDGGRQVIEILRDEITRTLKQLGCHRFTALDESWLDNQGSV